jgi:hypothetical protein
MHGRQVETQCKYHSFHIRHGHDNIIHMWCPTKPASPSQQAASSASAYFAALLRDLVSAALRVISAFSAFVFAIVCVCVCVCVCCEGGQVMSTRRRSSGRKSSWAELFSKHTQSPQHNNAYY